MDMLKNLMDLTPVLVIIVEGREGWGRRAGAAEGPQRLKQNPCPQNINGPSPLREEKDLFYPFCCLLVWTRQQEATAAENIKHFRWPRIGRPDSAHPTVPRPYRLQVSGWKGNRDIQRLCVSSVFQLTGQFLQIQSNTKDFEFSWLWTSPDTFWDLWTTSSIKKNTNGPT